MIDRFPTLSESFVTTEIAELRALGHVVSIEAIEPADVPSWEAARGVPVRFVSDETRWQRARDLAWLVARHPLRCARDVVARRAWSGEEDVAALRILAGRARRLRRGRVEHLHVHFAARSALEALRIGRILGLPYSLTAHAFDIFALPTNLRAKLEGAAVVTTGCAYNVEHLRSIVSRDAAPRVHEIVMGVDGERFRRRTPLPGGRTVVAVGRLVEKKGLHHLVEACALLQARAPLDAVVIVGEGRERARLEALVDARGLGRLVSMPGALGPDAVRAAMETADLLVMPSVIAADGDRDSMPVVVKEAMAMELLVAASDEVGLPECVRPPWGRLAPPGDVPALADAIEDLLALPPARRAEAGRQAREWVLEHAGSRREAERLVGLLQGPRGSASG